MKAGYLIAGLALVVGAMLPAASLAKDGTMEERTYVGPAPVFGLRNTNSEGADPPNVGFAKFPVGDADEVTITIDDASGLATSGMVVVDTPPDEPLIKSSMEDPINEDRSTGDVVLREFFCGSTETLTIPPEADDVNVFVGPIDGIALAPAFGETQPPVCPGPGTIGQVEAAWG